MALRLVVVTALILVSVPVEGQKLRGSQNGGCKGSFCDGVPEDKFAVLLTTLDVVIEIGNSESANAKCVAITSPVQCDEDAANKGKRLNDDDHADQFAVSVNSSHVCARRSDHPTEGWGQFLKIRCMEPHKDPNEKCMCLTTEEGDCQCKGCTDSEQQFTCEELLGPCACQRSEEAVCDCNGHCHTRKHREDACLDEPGCLWTGQWCEAQLGLLWD